MIEVIYLFLFLGLVIIYLKQIHKTEFYKQFSEKVERKFYETKYNLEEATEEKDIVRVSLNNFRGGLLFSNRDGYKRYFKSRFLPEGQEILLIFDVERENSHLEQVYYTDKQMKPKKDSRMIYATVLVDGKAFSPLLLKPIYANSNGIEIDDINSNDNKGRGIGTALLQGLFEVLKEEGVEQVFASLSPVDYPKKQQLYRFYLEKNGFVLKKELTDNAWGKVVKYL
ncbi:hypothetical protein M3172_16090 [Mesobacillus subterraneus]|uniref:hypothetical protein n=1 Tax=Mesobacillus subterraneus TaxID=285983 RepID=UPI00203E2EA6|nr:hypothetical protein [Mesobacillus subterraneus]MCM3574718.1 hypothetical protein [Mesobacillus subterraneus]